MMAFMENNKDNKEITRTMMMSEMMSGNLDHSPSSSLNLVAVYLFCVNDTWHMDRLFLCGICSTDSVLHVWVFCVCIVVIVTWIDRCSGVKWPGVLQTKPLASAGKQQPPQLPPGGENHHLLSGQRAKGRCWGKRFNGERKTMQRDKRPDKLAHVCSSCLFVPRSHLLSNRRLPLMAPQGFYLHPWTLANRETFPFFPCISFSGVISVVRIWADLTSVPSCISEHCWWTIQTFVRQLIAFAHLFQQF